MSRGAPLVGLEPSAYRHDPTGLRTLEVIAAAGAPVRRELPPQDKRGRRPRYGWVWLGRDRHGAHREVFARAGQGRGEPAWVVFHSYPTGELSPGQWRWRRDAGWW